MLPSGASAELDTRSSASVVMGNLFQVLLSPGNVLKQGGFLGNATVNDGSADSRTLASRLVMHHLQPLAKKKKNRLQSQFFFSRSFSS